MKRMTSCLIALLLVAACLAGLAPISAIAAEADALTVYGVAISATTGEAPLTVSIVMESAPTILGMRVVDEQDNILYGAYSFSTKENGNVSWKLDAFIKEAYTGVFHVYVRGDKAEWTHTGTDFEVFYTQSGVVEPAPSQDIPKITAPPTPTPTPTVAGTVSPTNSPTPTPAPEANQATAPVDEGEEDASAEADAVDSNTAEPQGEAAQGAAPLLGVNPFVANTPTPTPPPSGQVSWENWSFGASANPSEETPADIRQEQPIQSVIVDPTQGQAVPAPTAEPAPLVIPAPTVEPEPSAEPEPLVIPAPTAEPEPTSSVPWDTTVFEPYKTRTKKHNDQRIQSRTGPDSTYTGGGGFISSQITSTSILFIENVGGSAWAYTELQYATGYTRRLYFRIVNFTSTGKVPVVSFEGHAATLNERSVPLFGPGGYYDYYRDAVISAGTKLTVLHEENDHFFVEFRCQEGKARGWLPKDVVTIDGVDVP